MSLNACTAINNSPYSALIGQPQELRRYLTPSGMRWMIDITEGEVNAIRDIYYHPHYRIYLIKFLRIQHLPDCVRECRVLFACVLAAHV